MNIIITGGTGTLGYGLVEVLLQAPTFTRICIYSRDDHKQDRMREHFNDNDKLRFFVGDVRDKDRLKLALRGQHFVIHAAAMKIIPIAEYNPSECIKTIVDGTKNLIEAMVELANPLDSVSAYFAIPKIIGISTDKAVHPINLYGAAKLCAEKLILNANNIMGLHGPMFSIVRYGNVANSRGSVIEKFTEQIKSKKQLKITDMSMSRFWISLIEALDLVMYALDNMHGNEIFIRDMPSFTIADLAYTMMDMANIPHSEQTLEIIGVRPGEKMHEEIITGPELTNALFNVERRIYTTSEWYKQQKFSPVGITSNDEDVKRLTRDELRGKLEEIGVS